MNEQNEPKFVELAADEMEDVQGGIALKHKVTRTTDADRDKPKGNDQLAKGIIYSIGR